VNKVLALLKTLVSDDKSAAIIDANITPRNPLGNNLIISKAYAIFEHPDLLSHIDWHTTGSEQPISSLV
jgi:hypothetical protein